jgi:hypothetical protein
MNPIFAAAARLQAFCDQHAWRSCLIGGVAVQRWAKPRVTRDVDVTVLTGFGNEETFITELLAAYASRRPDARQFALRNRVLLLSTEDGVGIDVSLGALPFEENLVNHASVFSFGSGLDLRTCSAEDLIVLKLFASRPLDIRDAEMVAVKQPNLDWLYIETELRPLAEVKEEPEIMDTLQRIRRLASKYSTPAGDP